VRTSREDGRNQPEVGMTRSHEFAAIMDGRRAKQGTGAMPDGTAMDAVRLPSGHLPR
jgi:hypothetical protein